MIECEFLGGPRDGEVIALPDSVRVLKIAVPTRPSAVWVDDIPSMRDPCYREFEISATLVGGRWRLVWPKGAS